jgi:DNA-binding transcriptional regulator of glucitol operon
VTRRNLDVVRVLKVLLSRRWLQWHALGLIVIAAFVLLGRWQWHSAMSSDGTLQNLFYAFNWWVFAVLVVYAWAKTLRDELAAMDVEDPEQPGVRVPAPIALPALYRKPRPQGLDAPIEDDPELVAYNAYLAQLNERSDH